MACHIPEGGLDSRNLREALRNRPELWVDERVRVCDSLSLMTGVEDRCGDGVDRAAIMSVLDKVSWLSKASLPRVVVGCSQIDRCVCRFEGCSAPLM